jgi:uncharacterized repeat protein (TIGR04138 family)
MIDPRHPLSRLLEEDRRYPLEAYLFIFEALRYAQDELGMGAEAPTEPLPDEEPDETAAADRHVSGRELCEAIRRYALDQYGLMAKLVLNQWGIRGTGDFGEIVFNLIRVGQMRKTPADARVDFDDVFDFDAAFSGQLKFEPPR